MTDDFQHTSAAEMEDFLSKTDAEQKLRIWLNGRETNGHVAEAFDRIAKQGSEIQRMWISLSDHMQRPHPDASEYEELIEQHRDLWSVWRFSRWFIPISIPASIAIVTGIVELFRYWR